ncbi:MAG: iron chelate uptake ABC transporter family permease subunit, partial [Bdellovibrionales bacterium]|nr:iron chelate uptake ABC transporter family permease subunit [Bdellovibrionales bacterium]
TLAIAILVSLTGPIGFLGLVTPHFARILVGASHTKLVPVAFFSGGIFLVISDMVARLLGGMQEIPVGLITALIGCPIMAILLVRTLKVQTRDH